MRQKHVRIIEILQSEISTHDKASNRVNYQQFFKETLAEPTGLRAPVLRKISNRCYREIKQESAREILACCDALLASGERYMRFFAFEWAEKVERHYQPQDFGLFERWLKRYVNNWGACDHLCCGPLGHLLVRFPQLASKRERWTRSKHRWVRRAAAVSLIRPVRKGLLLKEVFRTAQLLLTDSDDMVQKGYGWMLKVATAVYPDEVFAFVLSNKAEMPRTALRYAIEKLPPARRKEAMRR